MAEKMLLLWGNNEDGQLGNRQSSYGTPCRMTSQGSSFEEIPTITEPTLRESSSPRLTGGLNSPRWTSLARSAPSFGALEAFSCAPSPCPVLSGRHVFQVACGSRHTLAIVEGGEAYSWGWGACGQLGHGHSNNVVAPEAIKALKAVGAATCVSAGGIHSAAVANDGRVYTWGGSSYGQLGLGPAVTTQSVQLLPEKVMLSETESPDGSPRASHTAGLTSRRPTVTKASDAAAMETTPKLELLAKVVACGGMHTAALTKEGFVYCWGRADSGQLGIGTEWVHETPSGVMGVEWPRMVCGNLEGRRTASIACGGFHTAAVTTDGDCYTWGKEDYGMLGCSNEALLKGGLFRPHLVRLPHPRDGAHLENEVGKRRGQKAVAVACGGWHTAVIGEEGGVWTCGRGEYGRLGLGDQKSQWLLQPVLLEGERFAPKTNATAEAGAVHLKDANFTDGTNQEAKQNKGGVILPSGGSANLVLLSPLAPPPSSAISAAAVRKEDPVVKVALGGSHSMALTSTGRVFAFGRQEYGRLGVEESLEEKEVGIDLPVEVTSLQLQGWSVESISAGGVHSAAILSRKHT